LVVAQNGNRNIVRIGEDGSSTVLADTYEGKPLNGPHDLMYRSDGVLYFSDPRASLPERINISKSSRPSSGVYSLYKGRLQLLTKDLAMPLGLALSRTGKYLFVIDGEANTVMRFDANADGSVSNTKLFFNLADLPWKQPSRGIAVDEQGNVYVAGPGGISIISPEGKRLGTILLQNQPRELAWGDLNGKALYLTTSDAVYQLRIGIPGVRSAGSKP
jgi:gluconolactonase